MANRPVPRTLTRAQQARRQRVVDAAMALGLDGGYEAVQMRDVASRADVAMGTVYRYFTSKDHLLAAALVHWVEQLDNRLAQLPAQGDSAAVRVMDVLDRALRAMGRQPQLVAPCSPPSPPRIRPPSSASSRYRCSWRGSSHEPSVNPTRLISATAPVYSVMSGIRPWSAGSMAGATWAGSTMSSSSPSGCSCRPTSMSQPSARTDPQHRSLPAFSGPSARARTA